MHDRALATFYNARVNWYRKLLVVLPSLAICAASLANPNPNAQQRRNATGYQPAQMGTWVSDEKFRYRDGTNWLEFDAKRKTISASEAPSGTRVGGRRRPGVARGRQATTVTSPNNDFTATCDGYNVTISQKSTGKTIPITQDGNASTRIKYGTASWVYGEELDQHEAMGFSPDNRFLWLYRFDESKVIDFPTLERQTDFQPKVSMEPYPLAGAPNPTVDLLVYDLKSSSLKTVPVRPGPFNNEIGHLIYSVQWSAVANKLLFLRTNRVQDVAELCSYDTNSDSVEVVDREEAPGGWIEPMGIVDFADGAVPGKLLIRSEASGYFNWYWLDIAKHKRTAITQLSADVQRIVRFDLKKREFWFVAAGLKHPMRHQLWHVKFDGSNLKQVTSDDRHHSVSVSPNGDYVADLSETVNQAPKLSVIRQDGKLVKDLLDSSVAADLMSRSELISVPTADGNTSVYVRVSKPVPFDPAKAYPVMMSVYGGPLPPSGSAPSDRFVVPSAWNANGYATVEVWGRGDDGRGKSFRQAICRKLGQLEIDDMATAAIRARDFAWIDGSRIGIEGTSYGGYASLMAILRYPDVFRAACSCSPVTDWRHYDTIYTERYMGLPDQNEDGYRAGAATTYTNNLKGWLMLYYGTADDNTHPTNTIHMVRALQRAQKTFELQIGPDQGHSGLSWPRMVEFFKDRMGSEPKNQQ